VLEQDRDAELRVKPAMQVRQYLEEKHKEHPAGHLEQICS
jgi:hypothetical protein